MMARAARPGRPNLEELTSLETDLDAIRVLADLIDDMVMEEGHSDVPMNADVHAQVIVLFDSLRARLKLAESRVKAVRELTK